MSYLELPAGISDCDKAVISLWFRVPNATLQAALALPGSTDDSVDDNYGTFKPPLYKVIPLLTFGSVEHAFATPADPISPSFIGVDCFDDVATLAVSLQMSNRTTFSQPPQLYDNILRPDAFYMSGWGIAYNPTPTTVTVTPDHWHHVLISFDLSLPCSMYTPDIEDLPFLPSHQVTPGPTFTWAFDDEHKVGLAMAPSGGANFVSAPGATRPMTPIPDDSIIPSALFDYVEAIAPAGGITATWDPVPLAMGHSIAMPTAAQFVESVHPIELAELQFFAGVALDTRTESNRRAFITAEGTPVPPVPPMIDNPAYDPDLPAGPDNPVQIPDPAGAPAEALLGQPPDILLHGSSNWIAGKNTGPMIDNPAYDPDLPTSATNPLKIPDPDFQFEPTGSIVAYTPDPSLHGEPPPEVRVRRMAIHA